MRNIKIPSDNKSGVIGVMWDKSRGKWRVEIKKGQEKIYGGRYNKKEDAIKARLILEKELFGDFAPQRELFQEYL